MSHSWSRTKVGPSSPMQCPDQSMCHSPNPLQEITGQAGLIDAHLDGQYEQSIKQKLNLQMDFLSFCHAFGIQFLNSVLLAPKLLQLASQCLVIGNHSSYFMPHINSMPKSDCIMNNGSVIWSLLNMTRNWRQEGWKIREIFCIQLASCQQNIQKQINRNLKKALVMIEYFWLHLFHADKNSNYFQILFDLPIQIRHRHAQL